MNAEEFFNAHRLRDYDENIIGTVVASHRSRSFSNLEWLVHEVNVGDRTVTTLEANGKTLFPVDTRVQVVAYASNKGYKVRAIQELKVGAQS